MLFSVSAQAQISASATYYLPYRTDNVLESLNTLYNASLGTSSVPSSPVQSYNSIATVYSGTVIYYDKASDGHETDPLVKTQSTTQIWGDGNTSNGTASGFPGVTLAAGDLVVFSSAVRRDHASVSSPHTLILSSLLRS